ncbi:hypothetical protein N8Z47_03110 [Salibacteraceae bacterium]|nr:hypothetical protein [Salibacteraceae bacterium]
MEAVQSIESIQSGSLTLSTTKPGFIARFDEAAEFNRYAIMSIGFLLVGIAGGAVVGFAAFDAIWKMSVIVAFSMLSVTFMLALAPMKWVTRSIILALLVDLLMALGSVL